MWLLDIESSTRIASMSEIRVSVWMLSSITKKVKRGLQLYVNRAKFNQNPFKIFIVGR